MRAIELLLAQHARGHVAAMSGGVGPQLMDQLLAGLGENELRARPAPALNSIAWVLWHLARSEDVLVNVLLADTTQVLDTADWSSRLALAERDMGTGMTRTQVDAVSARVALPALLDYQIAVGRRTHAYIATLREDDWEEVVEPQRLLTVGAFANPADGARRVETYWRGRTRGDLLISALAPHNFQHLGEALAIKSMLKARA